MTELKITLTNLFTGTATPGTDTYKTSPVDTITEDWFADNYEYRVDNYLDFLNLIPSGTLLNIQGYWGDIYLDNSLPDMFYGNGTYIGDGVKLVYKPREETIEAIKLHKNYLTNLTLFDSFYPFKSLISGATWVRLLDYEEGIPLRDIARILKKDVVLTFLLNVN